ncbi:MAG: hypothetical protein IJN69_08125 [Oscillospiraceae bacterium]|nr:hypothetical protein [Oscillospiraceae bacterium]MBR2503760.1 hypothetical protein [Oscillospiraceae bacterium]
MKIKKVVALVLSAALIVGVTAGGTFAWLIDKSETVTNTFTYGNIDITLDETKVDEDGNPVDSDNDGVDDRTTTGNTYIGTPGEELLKDPTVTVLEGSEKSYVFVKLVKDKGTANSFDEFIEYEIYEQDTNNKWVWFDDKDGNDDTMVYYWNGVIDASSTQIQLQILKDNKVKVKDTVTKDMIDALETAGSEYPSLEITAYAIQESAAGSYQEAWALITQPVTP